jgi:hypothetical protein
VTRATWGYVVAVGLLSVCVVALIVVSMARASHRWAELEALHRQGTVIRDPSEADAPDLSRTGNIAPFAKATVSSVDTSNRDASAGVADGVVDTREWRSQQQAANAWILLEWPYRATVEAIELYDRPSAEENVLGGMLIFDDGSMIPVGALPADGTPAKFTFAPKEVNSVMFRIDSAQGHNPGLAEIVVRGTLNR